MAMEVPQRKTNQIHEESWLVLRSGKIEELIGEEGRITYRLKIWDSGRQAFITANFNDQGPAFGLLERIRDDNAKAVLAYENGVVKDE